MGKQANCQVAVSVHAVSDAASCPLNWRLFLPREWADDTVRRRRTGVPEDVGHREKWRLALDALDALDELAGWGLVPPVVVADAGYGQNADFRDGLAGRGHAYVVGIRGDMPVQPHDAHPTAPAWCGTGRRPRPRYRQPPVTVASLAAAAGRDAFGEVTWREGSRGAMTSRFLVMRVRPAGVRSRRLAQAAAVARHGRWDGVLPEVRLLAVWPDGQDKPTRFWLSGLPDDTPVPELVRLAKIRWRIEHDYRELKHGLGLDHFEGRSWTGWHHHATLVTAAHAFLTEQRLGPKADTPASPSTRPSTPSRTC
ncbi:SRSO17 transposase [Streptomyces demainii]|uniref:SRSO17 transposase n=1 Tax=Streptomyces demainii TaxID=588122 RepID=A0ABT9KZ30_9ACTN|nr:SRSO17 transposase [Streptomyces demainii]